MFKETQSEIIQLYIVKPFANEKYINDHLQVPDSDTR